MNLPGLLPSRLALFAFAALLSLPVAAATPSLIIKYDAKAKSVSNLEVGFTQGSPKDNAVISVYEGTTTTGPVDVTMKLTQKGDFSSVILKHAGTYTLKFDGFIRNCSPELYVSLPQFGGAKPLLVFTADGSTGSSKISIKNVNLDKNSKTYFELPSDGSIKVTAPAK
jgi:hypothetical protein